jgi:hypothetical protein
MINRILNTGFIKGTRAAGLVYKIKPDGEVVCSVVLARLVKGKISVESGQDEIKGLHEVLKILDPKIPVVLLVDGKGIIHRKIQIDEGPDWLHAVLPNANSADFYLQHTLSDVNQVLVSIARKDLITGIVDELVRAGIKPVELLLGPFCLEQIIPFLETTENELQVDEYKLKISEFKIVDFSSYTSSESSSKINLGGEQIDSWKILPFSAAFVYFFQNHRLVRYDGILAAIRSNFIWGRFFRAAGLFALSFIFALLLINFFIFDHYNRKYQESALVFESNKMAVKEVDSLKFLLSKRNEFVTNTGLLEQIKLSYFADRIVAAMPQGIRLNLMNFNPVLKKINDNEKINFSDKHILIKGFSTESFKINSWIINLRKEQWLKDVAIENYFQSTDKNYGQFEMNITLK